MSERIAFFTFAVLKEPVGHAAVQGFIDRIAGVYEAMDGSAGFFARSQRDVETWEHSWGPMLLPQCGPEGMSLDRVAMTLSLWRDLKSVAAFAYRGAHGEALSRRTDWFMSGPWPTYAAWWIEADRQPNWAEAVERIDRLHEQGPTPAAFTFRQAFDADGQAA
jgi:hypothetical protein